MHKSAIHPLISPSDLAKGLNDPTLTLIDATWTFPGGPTPQADGSIPGAVFFDIDAVADTSSDLPHMLPTPEDFAASVGRMGIGHEDRMVIYDRIGMFSSARAWWTFRRMGAKNVSVLDGGLPAWLAEGLVSEPGPAVKARPSRKEFLTQPRNELSVTFDELVNQLNTPPACRTIVDARSAQRFMGNRPEPRPGLVSGHIPGSYNLPWTTLIHANGRMHPPSQLKEIFAAHNIDPQQPLVATCGSGITACLIALAAAHMGFPDVAVYDGSWAEWGRRPDAPIAVGAPPEP